MDARKSTIISSTPKNKLQSPQHQQNRNPLFSTAPQLRELSEQNSSTTSSWGANTFVGMEDSTTNTTPSIGEEEPKDLNTECMSEEINSVTVEAAATTTATTTHTIAPETTLRAMIPVLHLSPHHIPKVSDSFPNNFYVIRGVKSEIFLHSGDSTWFPTPTCDPMIVANLYLKSNTWLVQQASGPKQWHTTWFMVLLLSTPKSPRNLKPSHWNQDQSKIKESDPGIDTAQVHNHIHRHKFNLHSHYMQWDVPTLISQYTQCLNKTVWVAVILSQGEFTGLN